MSGVERELLDALGTEPKSVLDWTEVGRNPTADLDAYFHIPDDLRRVWPDLSIESRTAALLTARQCVAMCLQEYD